MTKLESATNRAFDYLTELRQTAAIRQFFSEIIIGRNGELMGMFGYDAAVKGRLKDAATLKATSPSALYRGLFIQANSVFEAYVRDLSSIVAENKASKVTKYSDLPENFRFQHIHLSGQILKDIKTGTVAGQKFDFDLLTTALGQCFSNTGKFSLMPEVFTLTMGNATPERIETLFDKLGLPEPFNPGVGQNSAIKKVVGESRQAVAAKLAREKLHTIISIRNTVVHGDLSAVVDQSDFEDSIDFIEAIIRSFSEIVEPSLV